ncbi:MAG: non-homologous end joining protein Ku [Arthrobacter sp.]
MSAATLLSPGPIPISAPCLAHGAGSAPRGRPSWSGLLKFHLVTVPVKAYPATASGQEIHFNQLHAGCGQRIRYEKHCPVHGKVEAGAIVSGYRYAPDQYVVVNEAELDQLRPSQDKALTLERFLDPHTVDPALFSGRTLYLGPDGLAAQHAYTVFAQVLRQRRLGALGRVVLSGHRHLVLVRPVQRVLAMHVLHFPAQLRSSAALEAELPPQSAAVEEEKMLGVLMDACSQAIAWEDYRDDRAAQVTALLEAKLQGRSLAAPAMEEGPVLHLLDALKQSVAASLAKQQRPSAKNGAVPSLAAATPGKAKRKPNRRRSA